MQERFLIPSWIHRFHHHISHAPLVMIDANLPLESLEAACKSKLFQLKVCMEKLKNVRTEKFPGKLFY
jgi:hypothetical protein